MTTQPDATGSRAPSTVASTGLATGLLALNAAMIPWFVSTILGWSTSDMLEDNLALYLLLGSLILGPLVIAITLRLAKSPNFARVLRGGVIHVGLVGQIVIDWLIYARFHALFPFDTPQYIIDGMPLQTGWIATDGIPFILFGAWAAWTMLLVVPSLVGHVLVTNAATSDTRPGMHLGFVILGLAMGLRWGGPWSATLHHLVVVAFLLPAFAVVIARTQPVPWNAERRHLPIFSTVGLFALLGFWLALPGTQASTQLATTWTWLVLAAASAALLRLSVKARGWNDSTGGKAVATGAWCALAVATACTLLANLNAIFSGLLLVWTCLGLAALSFFPEMLAMKAGVGRKAIGTRVFATGLVFIASIILAFITNVYDPVSTYAAFLILGIFFLMSFLVHARERDWSRDEKVYGVTGIVTSCTIVFAPFGILLGITSAIRNERKGVTLASIVLGITMTALLAVAIALLL